MTTTTQQISSNPALDFANAVLEETDGAREIIYMLHDIAQGVRENATTNDRMKASGILMDRGLGKCPKQSPAARRQTSNPNPAPPKDDKPKAKKQPESPRLVTQIDQSLHQSLGPPPKAHQPTSHSRESGNPESYDISHSHESENPESFDPYSIQQHILEITDGCRTLMTVLTDICRAPDDDSKVKESHRVKAGQMLIDRLMGTNPNALRSAVCPECRRKWSTHDGSHTHTETHPKKTPGRRMSKVDPEALAKVYAKLKQMEDEGILTPDPNAEKIDITPYLPPQDFDLSPYAKEEAAKFWANIELRYERQQQWPAIEERRRKKLEQIYPSHSEDDKPPDQ